MRYDSLRKLGRNRELVDYVKNHPDRSFAEVGQVFGISRATARTIYLRTIRTETKRT